MWVGVWIVVGVVVCVWITEIINVCCPHSTYLVHRWYDGWPQEIREDMCVCVSWLSAGKYFTENYFTVSALRSPTVRVVEQCCHSTHTQLTTLLSLLPPHLSLGTMLVRQVLATSIISLCNSQSITASSETCLFINRIQSPPILLITFDCHHKDVPVILSNY